MTIEELRGGRVHFLGIGGIGVSALARILMTRGVAVSGSDVRESSITRALEKEGAKVFIGHRAANLEGASLVVHSTAVPQDNPELVAARAAGLEVLHRSELLGALVSEGQSIGVTGTNGKGTVSAMITQILEAAGRNPSFYIGAYCLNFSGNARSTGSPWFVAELDESDGSVCNARPRIAVLNNLEMDHLNYYKDYEQVVCTLGRFFGNLPDGAVGVFNADDQGARDVAARFTGKKVFFGFSQIADFRVQDLLLDKTGSRFALHLPEGRVLELTLQVPGSYNVENAAAAAAAAMQAGVDAEAVGEGLSAFRGLQNRYTVLQRGDQLIIKDYISHPTGIRKVLETARMAAPGRLRAVFKPYRYTMINYHAENYAEAFRGADDVIVTEMWDAGEEPIPGVTTPWLTDLIGRRMGSAVFVKEMEDILPYLKKTERRGDTVVFFGGDDLFALADALAAEPGPAKKACAPAPAKPLWGNRDWKGVGVSVLGLARSGTAAANWLVERGADVFASDKGQTAGPYAGTLDPRVKVQFGENRVRKGDLVVISPGIRPGSEAFRLAHETGGEVISDIELFARLCPCPIAAVTGTDGKSTTTALLHHLIAGGGINAVLAGNIGDAVMGRLDELDAKSVAVLEISCFQLIHTSTLRPKVAILTNIAEDHVDYHGSMQAYIDAKKMVYQQMGPGDAVVLNLDDPVLRDFVLPQGVERLGFSYSRPQETTGAAWLEDGKLYSAFDGEPRPILPAASLKIIGGHNVMNALGALLAAQKLGVSAEQLAAGLASFPGLEHRMEQVEVIDDVAWYNDSKATNPHAAGAVLEALDRQVILIAGGSEKHSNFTDFGKLVAHWAKAVVLNGDTAKSIAESIPAGPPIYMEANLAAAVLRAKTIAKPGDLVVLAPACASFDQFKDFEHRGRVFKELVRALPGQRTDGTSR